MRLLRANLIGVVTVREKRIQAFLYMILGRFEHEHIHVCPLHMELERLNYCRAAAPLQFVDGFTTLSVPFQEVSSTVERGGSLCVSWVLVLYWLQKRCASLQLRF
jgi:hypothetical protein